MRILVTGATGYVGSVLVPQLLSRGHQVIAYDTQFFGNSLGPDTDLLKKVDADIRDLVEFKRQVQGCDAVIHMACLSNDNCCVIDPVLTADINFHAFEPIAFLSRHHGVKRFIYCSSSSVYGISDAPNVTEDHPLVPVSLYNRFKAECEPMLLKMQTEDFTPVIIRPATVCGCSPRMRFDLVVNVMTQCAILKGEITVFGGTQRRPNLHIDDMCDVYHLMLEAPKDRVAGQIFNVGRQNMTLMDIARLVQETVPDYGFTQPSIRIQEVNDTRSYHINSDKIKNVLNYEPKKTVEDAIRDICVKFKDGLWKDSLTNPVYTNVRQYVETYGLGHQNTASEVAA